MSYTIMSAVSFSKDMKQVKIKGASNNVVPKTYERTRLFDSSELLLAIASGNFQYTGTKNEQLLRIRRLAHEARNLYNLDGDMYDENSRDKKTEKYNDMSVAFLAEVKKANKGKYIIKFGDVYLGKVTPHGTVKYQGAHRAQEYGYEAAKNICNRYKGATMEQITPQ